MGANPSILSHCSRAQELKRLIRQLYTQDMGSQPSPLSRPGYLVHIPIKMAPHKLLDPSLALSMEVLELMHGGELLHIQPIGRHNIWGEGRRSTF